MDYQASRFWSYVNKTDACWYWLKSINGNGYGNYCVGGKVLKAHRVAYELVVGVIPVNKQLDHLCRNRNCVNPAHLEPVSQKQNLNRGINHQKNKSHCPQGHKYTVNNTHITPKGWRKCKSCYWASHGV